MPIRRQPKLVSDADLNELLARFEAGTKVDENNALHFLHLDFDELERILPDAFEGDRVFTPRQLRRVLREALRSCRKKGRLTIDGILVEARRLAKVQLARPPQQFAMWTKFRARQMAFTKGFRLTWNGVSIEATNRMPSHMALDEFFLNGHGTITPREPVFYGYLITRCQARDEETAAACMFDAIELFMAVFNLYERYGQWSLGNEWRPQGKLWSGPYHFLFRGKTFLGEEHFWYNPTFDEDEWGLSPLDMAAVLKRIPRTRRVLKALANHPLRDLLISVLRPMQDAFQSRDPSYVLLRYWSALEQLYGDPNSHEKSYSRIIQRATFAESDKPLARWKLAHISRLRNRYVHAGDSEDDLQVMAQHLRMLLSRHINYLLFHAPQIRSHAEWLAIVDLPGDEATLNERKGMIDTRLAIIKQQHRSRSKS